MCRSRTLQLLCSRITFRDLAAVMLPDFDGFVPGPFCSELIEQSVLLLFHHLLPKDGTGGVRIDDNFPWQSLKTYFATRTNIGRVYTYDAHTQSECKVLWLDRVHSCIFVWPVPVPVSCLCQCVSLRFLCACVHAYIRFCHVLQRGGKQAGKGHGIIHGGGGLGLQHQLS